MLSDILFKIVGSIAEAGVLSMLDALAKYLAYSAFATLAYFIFYRGLKPYKVLPDQMSEVLESLAAVRADMPNKEMLKKINLSAAKYDALHLRLDAYKQTIAHLNAELENVQRRVKDLEMENIKAG